MKENENKKSMPLLGDDFPEMKVVTTHGIMHLPKDFSKKWFVLFSHPGDFTPVCTTEFVAFQERYEDFKKLNCELIGLSVDQVFAHIKWTQWISERLNVKIRFPIIADNAEGVSSQLGLIHKSKGSNTVRAVFIVDPKGKIRAILYYPQELGRNIDEIVRMIKAFQISDEKKVAMPANWPKNELIDDRVILPPANTEADAEKATQNNECFDWWFCHKKL